MTTQELGTIPSQDLGALAESEHRLLLIPAEFIQRRLEAVYKHANKYIEGNLLDIGIFDGGPGSNLLKASGLSHLTAVDINPRHIEEAKNQPAIAAGIAEGKVTLLEMDVTQMTFEDETFDRETAIEVFVEIEGPKERAERDALKQMRRTTKKGGLCIVTWANKQIEFMEGLMSKTPTDTNNHSRRKGRIYKKTYFTEDMLRMIENEFGANSYHLFGQMHLNYDYGQSRSSIPFIPDGEGSYYVDPKEFELQECKMMYDQNGKIKFVNEPLYFMAVIERN